VSCKGGRPDVVAEARGEVAAGVGVVDLPLL
jgi:hypothetical protein